MKQLRIPLDGGAALNLQWGRRWANLHAYYNNQLLGSFGDREDLKIGKKFELPNGEPLMILLREDNLEVWYRGADLVSNTVSGATDYFQRAVSALQVVGFIQIFVAPILLLNLSEGFSRVITAGIVITGLTLLGMSYWAKRTGNKTPFWIGIAFCIPAFLLWSSLSSAIIHGILVVFLYKGTQATPPLTTRQEELSEDAPLDQNI
ncbi:MAG: hypothetical protein U0U46_05405 [Saprospiraceae bacterium]|nr:hypothetical protein [Saprospiraceae bacterium]HNL38123.1 hypothetical protein [Saprospiraceae bacterium]